MKNLIAALLVIFFSINHNLSAWGQTGHRVVGHIAQQYLDPTVAKKVSKILDGRKLSMVANWCDHIKSFKEHEHTFWWHFINIKDGVKYHQAKHQKNGDIIEAIERFSKTLSNSKLDHSARQESLKWLVHLLGDIHQPLHAGHAKDQGGNLIKLKWFGKESNLHEVWDVGLIDYQNLSFTELSDSINFVSVKQVQDWQDSDVYDWLDEAMTYRSRVYDLKSKDLSYVYQAHNVEFVNHQLLKAGVRLAGVLNSLLK
ncbi:MAG: S1/P1 nuclease [Candidatus Cloacimonetes bacterium]|nr:S1/P1 nuclease [Candidatus Cloacimonadota bacterium]